MRNMVDIVKNIQSVANQAYEANKPMALIYGQVTSTDPLKILVDQKLELTQEFLVLTRNVMDYDLEMTVNHQTEITGGGSGEASFEPHLHKYVGRKTFRVHNGLILGDTVLMLRDNGGQRYVIIDKEVR